MRTKFGAKTLFYPRSVLISGGFMKMNPTWMSNIPANPTTLHGIGKHAQYKQAYIFLN
jgi:hypothetical protein